MPDVVQTFVNAQTSEKTKRAYAYDLNKWFNWLGDRTPSVELAVDFRMYLEAYLASASAARIFNTCRTYYRWLKDAENPFEFVRSTKTTKNRTPSIPSDEEVADIIKRAGDDVVGHLIIAFCLNGLRSDEIVRLRYNDMIYSAKHNIFVIRVTGKGEKERMVPANNYLMDAITEYMKRSKLNDEFILERNSRTPWTTRMVQYVVEKYSEGKRRPHSLRHHYATRLIRNGATVFAVQRLLGHESVETTQIYVNLDFDDLIHEAQKDPLNA